jgi:predicted transcriptional regulator of viral defense system
MATSFQIAKKDIIEYFERNGDKIYTIGEISNILNSERRFWRLPISLTSEKFVELLTKYTKLKEDVFKFDKITYKRYVWGDISIFSLAASLVKNAYLSHYSALYLNDLTDQIPKRIYITYEQSLKNYSTNELLQKNIDNAFSKSVRTSNKVAILRDYSICLLNGQYTNRLGVIKKTNEKNTDYYITDIERTLIDITIRPIYSGGIQEVQKAFIRAANRVSINKMVAMLRKMKFIYPYHQSIGFYLQKAGNYRGSQIQLLKNFDMKYDFYLDHDMRDVEYSKEWKLYYPKGF